MPIEIEEIKEEKFWQEFFKKTAEREIPFKASFELTYQCNLHCRHCYIIKDPHKKELNTKEIFYILDQLSEIGCFQLHLTGGEIFTRGDILQILKYAKDKGFNISLSTNGTLITPFVADGLKELGPIWVEAPLYGITKDTHQAVTQVSGSLKRCLKGIELLKERDIPLLLKMTIMKMNIGEFEEVKSFADGLGTGFTYGYHIRPRNDGSKKPLTLRILPEEGVNLKMKNTPSYFKKDEDYHKPSSAERRFFYCDAGRNSMAITAYGRMNLCLAYHKPQYDLRRETISSCWRRLVGFVKSERPCSNYKCRSCKLYEFCHWCPVDGWLEKKDKSACIPYFKREAELCQERLKKVNG